MDNNLLYTAQDISLVCCAGLCCFGAVAFWLIWGLASRAGGGITEFLGGLIGGGGIVGLLNIGNLAKLGGQLMNGLDDNNNRSSGKKKK